MHKENIIIFHSKEYEVFEYSTSTPPNSHGNDITIKATLTLNIPENTMAHKHCKEMMQYAWDATETDTPWERWQYKNLAYNKWTNCPVNPQWEGSTEYRRKPKFVDINARFKIPEPYRGMYETGRTYFVPSLTAACGYILMEGKLGFHDFGKKGLIHLTAENAEAHAKALIGMADKEVKNHGT